MCDSYDVSQRVYYVLFVYYYSELYSWYNADSYKYKMGYIANIKQQYHRGVTENGLGSIYIISVAIPCYTQSSKLAKVISNLIC